MSSIEYPSDDESSDETSCYIYRVQHHNTGIKNPIISSPPSRNQLKNLANKILDNISEINNRDNTDGQKNYDCIAVAYTTNGEVYVAANVKERYRSSPTNSNQGEIMYGELGLNDRHIEPIHDVFKSQSTTDGQFIVTVVKQKLNANKQPTIFTNAKDHAEMQLLAYAEEKGTTISKMGTSKPACKNCAEKLEYHAVQFHDDEKGNKNPKNWADPGAIKTQELKTIPRDRIRVQYQGIREMKHSIPKRKAEAGHQVKKHFKQQMTPKPGCHVTASSALDLIEDIDKKPSARAGALNSYAGTYKKSRTGRFGAYAGVSVAEASAGFSICGASASVLSASAYAEGGTHWSAGANASLARAEAHAGPVQLGVGLNLNTGVSVGLDGVHASVLGFGVDIGPKLSIQTPVFDASCNVM